MKQFRSTFLKTFISKLRVEKGLFGSGRQNEDIWFRYRKDKQLKKILNGNISERSTCHSYYGPKCFFSDYFIQQCFICRPTDSTVPEDAGVLNPGLLVAT
jgi:hypothetical protein